MDSQDNRDQKLRHLIRHRRKNAEKRSSHFSSRMANPVILSVTLAGVFLLGMLAWAGYQYQTLTADLPNPEMLPTIIQIRQGEDIPATRFYDRSGARLIYTLENPGFPGNFLSTNPLETDHFSPMLVNAVVKLYEPGFWSSPGYSVQNMFSKSPATITERLVVQYLLPGENNGTTSALRMRILAARVASKYGRSKVLEWFLNNAYFGHLAYGADEAARLYLGKSAADLDLPETAFLLGVYEAPALNPIDVPLAAEELKRDVLDRLLKYQAINQAEYLQAVQTRVRLAPRQTDSPTTAPAFIELALQQLGARFNHQELERGGLKIITTLDFDLQKQVECISQTQRTRMQGDTGKSDPENCPGASLLPSLPPSEQAYPNSLYSSILVEDPARGEILAYSSGSTAGDQNKYSLTHQPGSLLTPFVAVAAFSRGRSPSSLVWDIPLAVESQSRSEMPDGSESRGPMRLRTAIANDYLLPIEKVISEIGAQDVWKIARPFGLAALESEKDPGALIYKGGSVTLPAMASAYSIFANQGYLVGRPLTDNQSVEPGTILEVARLDNAETLIQPSTRAIPVLSRQLAYLVHDVLDDESARQSSLGHPNPLEINRPAGVKVGQVQDKTGTWVVGYTPQRLVVAWAGYSGSEKSSRPTGYKGVAGLWNAVITYSSRNLQPQNWDIPPGISTIQVCDPSGLIPTSACPSVVNEVFLNGNEPVTTDNLYQAFQVNRETGRLATVFTPPELVEQRTYLVPPVEAVEWAKNAGLQLPPKDYDTIQPAEASADALFSAPPAFSAIYGQVAITGTAKGDQFKSYRLQAGQGLYPKAWIQVGDEHTKIIENGLLGNWDTTQQPDGLYALRLIVTRTDMTIVSAATQVTLDNTPPDAQITYPVSGQQFNISDDPQLKFSANANDLSGVAHVEWYLDGNRIAVNKQPPYQATWGSQAGQHQLYVKVLDMTGNEASLTPVSFSVQ